MTKHAAAADRAIRKTRHVLRVSTALVLVLSLWPPAAGAKASGAVFEGQTCTEAMAFFFRDKEALSAFIPGRFTPDEVFPGLGELLVMITRCEGGTLNGKKLGALVFSEVGIYIEKPKEVKELEPAAATGFQYYQLWHLTDLPSLRRAMAKLGVDGAAVADATFEAPSPAQIEARMPWERESYGLNVVHGIRQALFRSRPSTFWHLSRKGLAATTYTVSGQTFSSGVVEVEADEGVLTKMIDRRVAVADQGVVATYPKLSATSVLFRK